MKKALLSLSVFFAFYAQAQMLGGGSFGAQHNWENERNSYKWRKEHGYKVLAWQRSDIGYSFMFQGIRHAENAARYDPNTQAPIGDTNTSEKLHTLGFHIMLESASFIPLSRVGENTMLALSYAMFLGWNNYEYHNIEFPTMPGTMLNVQVAVPIGLSLRTGGAAVLDKTKRFTAAGSLGLMPIANWMDLKSKYQVTPFASAEVGFFLGICFKVRGTVGLGKEYALQSFNNNFATHTFYTKPLTTLTILIMPYSYDWGND